MAQEIINTGATANDGTGDPLRTAFIKTDNNFDQIWAAGPVGTNVQISGNTITTLQVNQDLVLAPNGVANIRLNNNTIPNANNIWYLGSVTNRWRGLYVGNVVAGNITISNNLVVPGDTTIGGNLTVEGDTIQIGNIVTDTKTIQLANTATTDAAADGSGITVGASDDVATLLYNSTNNEWRMNIGANVAGNITAQYFIGDGSQLTGLPEQYGNANVAAYLPTYGGNLLANTVEFTGELAVARRIVVGTLPSGNIEILDDTSGNGPALKTPGGSGLDLLIEPSGNLLLSADGGVVIVEDQTPSTDANTGALLVYGGIGVNGNINIGGNLDAVGNISANYFIGASSNVELVAGDYTWTFDNTGNTSFANGTVTVSNLVANGTASLGNTATVTTSNYQIGYRDIPQVAFTGNATLAATDAGKHFYSTESTDYILTIADNSAVSWPVGTAITVVNLGTGNITVTQASGVSLYLAGNSSAGNRNVTTYGMATLLNVAANVWMINGTGVS